MSSQEKYKELLTLPQAELSLRPTHQLAANPLPRWRPVKTGRGRFFLLLLLLLLVLVFSFAMLLPPMALQLLPLLLRRLLVYQQQRVQIICPINIVFWKQRISLLLLLFVLLYLLPLLGLRARPQPSRCAYYKYVFPADQ